MPLLPIPFTLAGIDFQATAADLDATFRRHGAKSQACPQDLLFQSARGGLASIASFVLESDAIARAVVSHVRVAPFVAGIAVTVHPRHDVDAPMLVADVMALPPGSSRAFIDACGPGIARAGFTTRFRGPLSATLEGTSGRGVKRADVPEWIAPLSGGCGASFRARRGRGAALSSLLVRYVDAYLAALATASTSGEGEANAIVAKRVRDAVRANGPARKHLARSFGDGFTSSYMRLLWREDAA